MTISFDGQRWTHHILVKDSHAVSHSVTWKMVTCQMAPFESLKDTIFTIFTKCSLYFLFSPLTLSSFINNSSCFPCFIGIGLFPLYWTRGTKDNSPSTKDHGSNHWWHPLPTIEFNTFLLRRQFVAQIPASGLVVRVDILLAAISWWLWFVCHFPLSIFHFPL